MPSSPSPSSSVQAARQAIADRLRELRLDADLSSHNLSAAAGWHPSKTSRIERAVQPVTKADIRVWCRICGADNQTDDLIAALRAVEGAYVEWRRLERTGLRRLQDTYVPLYDRTKWFRNYQSHVMPGLLQTAPYAAALLGAITSFRGIPNDAEAASQARIERQRILYSGKRFAFLVEESVLRSGVGGPEVMAGQLGRLLEAMGLPSVSLGIIPAALPDRPMWTLEGFTIFDDSEAQVELLTARLTVTAPGEIQMYRKAFAELSEIAVSGAEARSLIGAALEAL